MTTVIINTTGTVKNDGGAVAHGGIGGGSPTVYSGLKPFGAGSDDPVQSSTVLTSTVSAAIPLSTVENVDGVVGFTSPTAFSVGDVVSIGGDTLPYTLVGSYLITATGNSGLYLTDKDFPTTCVGDILIPSGSGSIDAFTYGGNLNNVSGDFILQGTCTAHNGKEVAGGPPHIWQTDWNYTAECPSACTGLPINCPTQYNDASGAGVDLAVDTSRAVWNTGAKVQYATIVFPPSGSG